MSINDDIQSTIKQHGEAIAVMKAALNNGTGRFEDLDDKLSTMNESLTRLSMAAIENSAELRRHMEIEEQQRDASIEMREKQHAELLSLFKDLSQSFKELSSKTNEHEAYVKRVDEIGWETINENHKFMRKWRNRFDAAASKFFIALFVAIGFWVLVLIADKLGLQL